MRDDEDEDDLDDDGDEVDVGDGDDDDADAVPEVIEKGDLLEDIAEALADTLDDYIDSEVKRSEDCIELDLNDDSKWRLTLRKIS